MSTKASTTSSRQQPAWLAPKPDPTRQASHPLKMYNSLTCSKVPFVPSNGERVTWYNCGPTVYDASHMGHARVYVTVDIIRRIMQDYFNYDVSLVMNITDIDDKIILRARQNHLFEQWVNQNSSATPALLAELQEATNLFIQKQFGVADLTVQTWAARRAALVAQAPADDPKFALHVSTVDKAVQGIAQLDQALQAGAKLDVAAVKSIAELARDPISAWLDQKYGASVTDPKVFRQLAAHWESEYFKDMDALNIEYPNKLTRVSEYVPEIVDYIQRIIDNGFAYEADGSVYFDTQAFDKHPDHSYAKLEPWSAGNAKLLEEGEGSLGSKLTGKKASSDFALWKRSKPGEPTWDSPWSPGRPGWHIECSVMASEILGANMDIHSGGIDLAFPHHDNELAQSEAYHNCSQWVNYFLHPGHLHIEGAKMSKSLKNFITIREALEKYTARQIRFLFLLQQWDRPMDFKDDTMKEAIGVEETFDNFFMRARTMASNFRDQRGESTGRHQFHDAERALDSDLAHQQDAVRAALCDSFNTPQALQALIELVKKTNVYINRRGLPANVPLVEEIARYITKLFKVFGLAQPGSVIGFGNSDSGTGSGSTEDIVRPYVKVFSEFRDEIRQIARANKDTEYLKLCDQLRDVKLADIGVILDDKDSGTAEVNFGDPAQLARARELKKKEVQAKKAAARAAQEQKRLEKLLKGKVSPQEMFQVGEHAGKFSDFDNEGLPRKNDQGEELSSSQIKKLKKQHKDQAKLHEAYLASLAQS
ncbi:cysteinyl-tRNA synthetase [Dimargaris cristalligena]|uniref:cysteine--tRNA ligase n=1 Tax=Dimargaris cristalligena TaxID=215637 RepID=A0A4P9ZV24_9FUNG|nr:cysteinyl-tRNA synthetase [Dimargaris cristalligena]|eukprot:RKP36672.1 cysteinyl-tRNA synthetase [Dimargaris cristalligena]